MLEILKAVLLGIVQGITEWLPISSTGHMILVDEFIMLAGSEAFRNTFFVVIQFGSILAVITLYFHKLNPFSPRKSSLEKRDTMSLWFKVLVAIIPSGVIGILFDDIISAKLTNSVVVSIALIVYGVIMILIEQRNKRPVVRDLSHLTYTTAFGIGIFQCLSLIPGTSRSGSTIIGALLLGTARPVAAEFSFFMAIPTMIGASGVRLLKSGFGFTSAEWMVLIVGSVVAYLVSIVAIKFLMDYVRKHDFKPFGWYRIVLGILVLLYFFVIK